MVPVATIPTKNDPLPGSQATPSGLLPSTDGSSLKTLAAVVWCAVIGCAPWWLFADARATPPGPASVSARTARAVRAFLIRIFMVSAAPAPPRRQVSARVQAGDEARALAH